ncbi:hypothetical protein DCC81_04950 [Chitinophaga parva]|uniref:Uncharacterized protein n=1 Tax=Chitinophaga parva TaxID=2169414 RepID=A0A2T7BMC3_9BACT|nr:hypothetical protein [Chitinophaga parva]PUZ28833.1 hypothetical protein DCC81_04950 [Chitinophaga parva]
MILHPWFKKYGITYVPLTIGGSLVTVLAIALCGWLLFTFDRGCHSLLSIMAHFFLYFTVVGGAWTWVAARTSVIDKAHEQIH